MQLSSDGPRRGCWPGHEDTAPGRRGWPLPDSPSLVCPARPRDSSKTRPKSSAASRLPRPSAAGRQRRPVWAGRRLPLPEEPRSTAAPGCPDSRPPACAQGRDYGTTGTDGERLRRPSPRQVSFSRMSRISHRRRWFCAEGGRRLTAGLRPGPWERLAHLPDGVAEELAAELPERRRFVWARQPGLRPPAAAGLDRHGASC